MADWWTDNGPPQQMTGATPAAPPGAMPSAATPQGTGAMPSNTGASAYSFPIPPGFDPNNPTDKLVLDNFEKYKARAASGDTGAQPTAANLGYWRQQINDNGGAADPSKAQYWNEKMTPGAGSGGGNVGGGAGGYTPGAGTGGFGNFAGSPAAFQAPSGLDMSNDPGYLARMKMGTDAIQGAAAAKGSVLSGGTLKALERYGQDYGSNEYGNVYGRASQGYTTNTGTQRNAMGDYWQRLQGLYQGGQQAGQQTYQKP